MKAPTLVLALIAAALPARAAERDRDLFEMIKVADGVYAAVARPYNPMNCNAAVVINDKGVLVVDSHSTPSSARALMKQIAAITKLPVRYMVNTHFHSDHARGNAAYQSPYPREVTVISTDTTRQALQDIETGRLAKEAADAPGKAAAARAAYEKDKTPAAKETWQQLERYAKELKTMHVVLPTMTFDKSLVLHDKAHDVFVLFLGRAHTGGDAVVYLPKEKVLVTGDLITQWGPGMGDGYPNEWPKTLEEIGKLDVQTVIGGHGKPGGREMITNLRAYMVDLLAEVRKEFAKGTGLDEAKKVVSERLVARHTGNFAPGEFDKRVPPAVEKVYGDLKEKRY